MTYKNNFDKSSTGTDVEFRGYRDIHQAQILFSEAISVLQHDGYGTTAVGYYADGGCDVPGPDDVSFTVKGERAVKIAKLEELSSLEKEDIEQLGDSELDSELLGYYEVTLIDYALDRMDCIDGLEFVPVKDLIVLTTRGYSQGHYAKVIYCPADLEAAWGRMPERGEMQTSVDRLYWDCPVYACVTVNDNPYEYSDMPEFDEYEWEREKYVKYVAEKSGVSEKVISDLVPTCLDYC